MGSVMVVAVVDAELAKEGSQVGGEEVEIHEAEALMEIQVPECPELAASQALEA